jgi:hypothetical protein
MALFLRNKIKHQIALNGYGIVFIRYALDNYKQVSDEIELSYSIYGLYHTTDSYNKRTGTEDATRHAKQQPRILCLIDDAEQIKLNDVTFINGVKYYVVGKEDINNFGVACDISLEAVQDGE